MIPLRDTNPSRTVPIVNYILIAANLIIFLFELSLDADLGNFIYNYGVVPATIMNDFKMMSIGVGSIFPFFSSMFLHGGWMHLIGNMLFLYIFGDNIEDKFGHIRYFIFYILAGVSAAVMQTIIFPDSTTPMVGASGAIAGVLGAYVFLFPGAKIVTLIPIFFFFQIVELPAFLFLGIWFAMQIFSGLFSLGIGADAGGVAWWAHIGGFLAGVIMLPFFRKRS
ncbi:MAG: rhomboid family intramembrane serine protease [Ignavibacteriales bacterium]|nr:rhomboid family intramembrane serine protease [Ignavibacteriales bacterium]